MLNEKYFNNYDSFNEVFSLDRNTKQRKNKLFLQAYKHAIKTGERKSFQERFSFPDLQDIIRAIEQDFSQLYYNRCSVHAVQLLGRVYPSSDYYLDEFKGLCQDYDKTAIRYLKDDKSYKMKSGKFMRRLMEENGIITKWGEVICNYYGEQFSEKWKAYTSAFNVDVNLKVDEDFEFIYSSRNYSQGRDFGSCMSNNGYHSFYNDSVNASAASILDEEGKILARCIIYKEVRDDRTGNMYRLAERQYSKGGDNGYMRMLVSKLIKAELIDGFKTIGAGCHDEKAFVTNDDNSMRDMDLSIHCYVEPGGNVSYQDSFKYYNQRENRAYNNCDCSYTCSLESTGGNIEDEEGENYDEYNEEHTSDDLTTVGVWNCYSYRRLQVSEDYAQDNFHFSSYHDMYLDETYYSDIMGEELPKDMYDEIEEEYKENNWSYDEINKEYIEETWTVNVWDGDEYISTETSEETAEDMEYYGGEYYDQVGEGGIPFGMELVEA